MGLCYPTLDMEKMNPEKTDEGKIPAAPAIIVKIKSDQEAIKEDLTSLKSRQKKKNRIKTWSEILLLAALSALVLVLFLQFGDIAVIASTFHEIANGTNWVWLLVAIGLLIIYLAIWPLPLRSFTKALRIDCSFRDVYEIGEAEHFYNGITPFATGGEPFQIYFFKTVGVETSAASGAILASFTVHLFVSNVFAISALFFYPYFVQGITNGIAGVQWLNSTTFGWIVGVGYLMNFLTLLFPLVVGTSRHFKNVVIRFAKWLSNFKLFRKALLKQIPVFEKFCDDTQEAYRQILHHPKAALWAVFWRFIADFCYYAIPFFLLLSVGADFSANPFFSFWLVLFGTSFAITSVVWVPVPGSTGSADYAFAIVVASLAFGEIGGPVFQGAASFEAAKVVSLLWRMLTFYLVLFVSFGFSMSFQLRNERRQRRELKELDGKASALTQKLASEKNDPSEIENKNK